MKITISKIPEEGLRLTQEASAEILGLKEDLVFQEDGPVCCELYVQVVDGALIARGTVSATVRAHCARCSQIFSTTVSDSGFLRDYSDILEVEEVDLTEGLREAILLNLPHFPLCDEGCKGLCVQCGNDLNKEPCGCPDGSENGAWEALDSLNL